MAKIVERRLREGYHGVNLTIDGKQVVVPEGTTIYKAALQAGITIPTLCFVEEVGEGGGTCGMCSVEVEGEPEPQLACKTPVSPGMVVRTDTPRIREIREAIQMMIRLAKALPPQVGVDRSALAVVFTPHKCIACRRCEIICQRVQTVRALALKEVKKRLVIAPIRGQDLSQTPCVQCGQCIEGCLTGALRERDQREELLGLLEDRSKHVVIQTSPASRVSLGEIFFYPPGQDVTGKMVSALKVLGFAAVFDTSFGADVTSIEEAEELRGRLLEAKPPPFDFLLRCLGAFC